MPRQLLPEVLRVLLDKSPGGNSPGVFSHANRVVKKFPGGVFLVQATGTGRVSGDINRQLKVVIGNLQLVEGIPKLLGVESTLHQAQLQGFLDRLGFLPIFRHVITGLGIGETGRVRSVLRSKQTETVFVDGDAENGVQLVRVSGGRVQRPVRGAGFSESEPSVQWFFERFVVRV